MIHIENTYQLTAREQLQRATDIVKNITPSVLVIANILGVQPKDLAKGITNDDSLSGYMGIVVAELMKLDQEAQKKTK